MIAVLILLFIFICAWVAHGRDPFWLMIEILIHLRVGIIGAWQEAEWAACSWWRSHPERVKEMRRAVAA